MASSDRSSTRECILNEVKRIVLAQLAGTPAKVYLFGSWARGEERRTSDIDVAIWTQSPLPTHTLMQIRFSLEESTIPYRVDVVNLNRADEVIQQKVKEEGIVWKDCENE